MDLAALTDLTFTQLKALMVLRGAPQPLSVNELADRLSLSIAAAGRCADRLVQEGIVDRREDDQDRRVKRLSLTDFGHETVDRLQKGKEEAVRALTRQLPAELRAGLVDGLTPILDSGLLAPGPTTEHRRASGAGRKKTA